MSRAWLLVPWLAVSACLKPWDVGGPWACGAGDVCPEGLTCDDGVCCVSGGAPACPTLPLPSGGCPDGGASTTYFRDEDGDHDGNPRLSRNFCAPPLAGGWVTSGGDCDDASDLINSSSAEQCNGRDDDCDGVIDEGLTPQQPYYLDEDGDGFGARSVSACAAPPGYVTRGNDCEDSNPQRYPGAPERCNGVDDDCDGQPDAPGHAFIDTDEAGEHDFPCVAQPNGGVCSDGLFRCLASNGTVGRVCQPLQSGSLELCDGVDNDCDGQVDEAPACGGPPSLFDGGLVFAARRLSVAAAQQLNDHCQAHAGGTVTQVSSNGKTWQADGGGSEVYHVWSAEAPDGGTWDLSKPDLVLRVAFTATAPVLAEPLGAWGSPGPPNNSAFNPVVYLCGDDDSHYMRYRTQLAAPPFRVNDTSFDVELPLNNLSPAWIVGNGSGFDTHRVRRVEVMLFTVAPNFKVTFSDATGFVP